MHLLLFLTGLMLPGRADAALESVGGFAASIWSQACTVLPYCGSGGTGVLIVTGIVTEAVLWTIGAGAVVVILYAAVRIVSSGANEEVISKSKKIIFYACLGILLAILGSTIVNYVFSLVAGIASV